MKEKLIFFIGFYGGFNGMLARLAVDQAFPVRIPAVKTGRIRL
jgi:hypothetical protein